MNEYYNIIKPYQDIIRNILIFLMFLIVFGIPTYAINVNEIETSCSRNSIAGVIDCFTVLEFSDISLNPTYEDFKRNSFDLLEIKVSTAKRSLEKTLFEEIVWDKDSVRIAGSIPYGSNIYWGIEGLWASTWWNDTFPFKKQLNVSVASGTTESAFCILVWVSNETEMQEDYDDIRFVNETENGDLGYWLEEYNTTHAKFWVESDQNITTTPISYYMYYGNNDTNTTGNISHICLFGDDFNRADGAVGNSWADVFGSGSTAILNNWMTITNDNDDFEIIQHDFPARTEVKILYTVKYDDVTDADGWRWGGSLESWSHGRDHALMQRTDNIDYYGNGDYTQLCNGCTANNVAYLFEIRAELVYINVSMNDTDYNNEYERTATSNAVNFSEILLSSKGGVASYDNVLIRAFHDPEPTVIFGDELEPNTPPENISFTISVFTNYSCIANQSVFNKTIVYANSTNATELSYDYCVHGCNDRNYAFELFGVEGSGNLCNPDPIVQGIILIVIIIILYKLYRFLK